jgi:DNA repair protein RecN (Recombination protein N)
MLKEIAIHNFAIIDELELTFSDGFNAFTGETGAGKSIILDAVSMVLGGKSDPTFVRDGSGRAVIEAVFSCGDYKEVIREILLREDLLDETDFEELIMTREIRAEGRSIARINGHNVSLSVMHEIGEYFVDIHGQSEHLSLLNPRNHIHILDRFAMNQDLLKVYHEKLKKLQTVQRQLKSLRVGEEESLRQKDMLTFQINEIESAKISENEEVDLIKERDRLGNIENLSKYIRQSIQYLEGNNTEIPGIIDLLGLLTKSFENLVKNDSDIQTVSDTVFSISEQANEIYDFLQHYQDRLEFNPHRLEQIEERLMIINGLKRKYGGSIPNVLSFALKEKEKLSHLENSEEEIENLVEQEKQLLNELSLIACQLSEKRIASARKVSQDVEKELGDLHMANAKFQVSMTTREDENGLLNSSGQRFVFNENGFDEVEFLIAPNPGEGLKPLSKIASGGETSRLMLALKNSLASADAIPTLVFDEIDQGIGGRIGSIVGEKIWNISRNHQVLCITHLPQLAAFFDVHFHVSKEVINGRTRTIVQRMDRESSIHEMASLLGSDSEENILAAEAMLKDAEPRKSKKK